VTRLPTDSRTLSSFLSRIEGKPSDMQSVASTRRDLLVVLEHNQDEEQGNAQPVVVPHDNVLEEGYFQNDWSAGLQPVDHRDAMHHRGWTHFRVRGHIGSLDVTGTGRVPFVYATCKRYSPWLKLRVGDALTLADGGAGAIRFDAEGTPTARYPRGSFFKGMARPWMGLHAIDTVRRDAAEQRVPFETRRLDNGRDVQVAVFRDAIELVYTIDLETDVVTAIEFVKAGTSVGRLEFEYLQDLDSDLSEFTAPADSRDLTTLQRSPGLLWLVEMAGAALGE
jgi:hypothetical protein